MKKILFLFLIACLAAPRLNAQTAEETMQWLNAKTVAYSPRLNENSMPVLLVFTDSCIQVKHDGNELYKIQWRNVSSVLKTDTMNSFAVSGTDDKGSFIGFRYFLASYGNSDNMQRYYKALQHLASLKATKLVKDDLF